MLSDCCHAPCVSDTEVSDGIGLCAMCRDWCSFTEEEDEQV